jgi:hypothetical protein
LSNNNNGRSADARTTADSWSHNNWLDDCVGDELHSILLVFEYHTLTDHNCFVRTE